MAVTLAGGCRVSEMREGVPVVNGTLRIWNQIGHATGATAISLRVMEFAPGLSPGIRNEDCDEILYVVNSWHGHPLHNEVSTTSGSDPVTAFINGASYDIHPDTGIYIRPNETFAVDNPGPDLIVLVGSQCPEPDAAPEIVKPSTSDSARQRSPLVRPKGAHSLAGLRQWRECALANDPAA